MRADGARRVADSSTGCVPARARLSGDRDDASLVRALVSAPEGAPAAAGPHTVKQVHIAKHAPEAHLVKGYLESLGIVAVVRGEFLTGGWGELPVDVCSVWVEDEAQYERAEQAVREFLSGALAREHRGRDWRCPYCGEHLEGQFTRCWNCGAIRSADA